MGSVAGAHGTEMSGIGTIMNVCFGGLGPALAQGAEMNKSSRII